VITNILATFNNGLCPEILFPPLFLNPYSLLSREKYVNHLKRYGIQIAGPVAEKSEVLNYSVQSRMLAKVNQTL